MIMSLPYARYACPCTDVSAAQSHFRDSISAQESETVDEHPLDPHSPRTNYLLFPIDQLLFCNDCYEIRCARCVYEETIHHFCPNCLFEVGKATVKNDTDRCTRSCFICPLCTSTLATSSYLSPDPDNSQGESGTQGALFILTCPYCAWSSLDTGITFEKPTNISGQLVKHLKSEDDGNHYQQLVSFYKQQLADSNPTSGIAGGSSFGLDSPSLFRLLSNYGHTGLRKPRGKIPSLREADNASEGLVGLSSDDDWSSIEQMANRDWDSTLTVAERERQSGGASFTDQARPVPVLLRSKRAKRCRKCRHQLAKQDDKLHSTKWRIRLVAINYIPSISVRPLSALQSFSSLQQSKAIQFLITLRNPLFDPLKVSLATPAVTPGKVQSKVTILCPQFEVGAATDVWDEALDATAAASATKEASDDDQGLQQLEAGKIWGKGKNWTTIACEVVPGALSGLDLEDGDDMLEVPVHVHVSYEMDEASMTSPIDTPRDGNLQKEIAFWVVLGLGRIKQLK